MDDLGIPQLDNWLIDIHIYLIYWVGGLLDTPCRPAAKGVEVGAHDLLYSDTGYICLYCSLKDKHECISSIEIDKPDYEFNEMSSCCSGTKEDPIARRLVNFLVHWNISQNSAE